MSLENHIEGQAPPEGGAPPVEGTPPPVQAPVRPEGLADQFWDETAGVKTDAVLARLTELETAAADRGKDVPATAAEYKLDLGDKVLGMDGKPVQIASDDPFAKSMLDVFHKNGLAQPVVTELVAAYAASEVAQAKAHDDAMKAETAKLGEKAGDRLKSVKAAISVHAGDEGATAIMADIGSAAAFQALEKVIAKLAGPEIKTPEQQVKADEFEGLTGLDLLTAVRAKQAK